jgi:fructosamine-3-kinase
LIRGFTPANGAFAAHRDACTRERDLFFAQQVIGVKCSEIARRGIEFGKCDVAAA